MNTTTVQTNPSRSFGFVALSVAALLMLTAAPATATQNLSKEASKQDSPVEVVAEPVISLEKAESETDGELKNFWGRKYRHYRYGHRHHGYHH